MIRLNSEHLERVQRAYAHTLDAGQIAAFFGACEISGAFAGGDELWLWRKAQGAAFQAWRKVTRARRRELTERWRDSAEALVANARKQRAAA